jgi:hypothetical protein
MIPEFVSKTAEWMRSKKLTFLDDSGTAKGYFLAPNKILISPARTSGPAVKALKYESYKHRRFDQLIIDVRASKSWCDCAAIIRFPEIVDRGDMRATLSIKVRL